MLAVFSSAAALILSPGASRADLWTTAYYPGWTQDEMPASDVDFPAVTHIIHFSVIPKSDGSLDTAPNVISAANSADLVSRGHAAGRKVLISVGGGGTQSAFQSATLPANRGRFVTNLVNFVKARGYDGVDIDWEPLDPGDAGAYTNFIRALRIALDGITPRPMLTAAVAWEPALIASLETQFDQINIMTYDLAGPYPGWVTWFNAPIFDGGYRFPSTGGLVPSANGMVDSFVAAGIPPSKLGIGIAFYGAVWSGGTGTSTGGTALPRQDWTTVPTVTAETYETILSTYYSAQRYRWDTNAQAAYLTIDNSNAANDKFISYDDERTCQAKVSFARNRGLGGVMIWELRSAYFPGRPAGQRDPLLQTLKQSMATPRFIATGATGTTVRLTFSTLPLANYRVQWTSDIAGGTWNTLTNVAGTGAPADVFDSPAPGGDRFYRVQTPP